MLTLGQTDLEVYPLCLGGSVFGWTADERESFAVMDAYVEAGGNFIDTADVYSAWVPGHKGGESEAIIGRWLTSRGNRDRMVLATKVGHVAGGGNDLTAATIGRAIDASLRRLQTDRIDVYYAHADDLATPLEETLGAFATTVRAGKVRYIAASNYAPARLDEALGISAREGWPAFAALQVHYNLIERDFENELQPLCAERGLVSLPYAALARGFLTGKHRAGTPAADSRRDDAGTDYIDERTPAVLAVLEEVAEAHQTSLAAVSLSWLAEQPTVGSPVASARTLGQLAEILPAAQLRLAPDEKARLSSATSGLTRSSANTAWFPADRANA